eukprot:TRINITY_DN33099_c0_g1_i1.p1 TRINITY_DN33099_c0_g1~~TRINITY_DN33099_c0_g1_i1.p1  ORF type:complete len:543 (-),score=118.10 TRINITY_DN33099_c0_g1_i1:105-1628(-)
MTAGYGGSGKEDPLDLTLSTNLGEGENSMKSVVGKHFQGILAPLAEHVRELQSQMHNVMHEAALLAARVDKADAIASQQERQLGEVWSAVAENTKTIHDLPITQLQDRTVKLESDTNSMSAALNKADDQLQGLTSSHAEMRRVQDDHSAFVTKLQRLVGPGEGLSKRMDIAEASLADAQTHLRSMAEQQAETTKGVMETRKLLEGLEHTSRRLAADVARNRKESDQHFARLSGTATKLDSELRSLGLQLRVDVRRMQELVNTTSTNVTYVGGRVERLEKLQLEDVGGQEDADEPGPGGGFGGGGDDSGMMNKLFVVQRELAQCVEDLGALKDDLSGKVTDLGKKIPKLTERVETAEDSIKEHAVKITTMNRSISDLEKHQDELTQKTHTQASTIKEMQQTDEMLRLRSQQHQDDLDKDKQGISKAQAELEAHGNKLDDIVATLNGTNGTVTKIGTQVSLAHEYLQGLKLGFQDTNRKVQVGENGMLSPKSARGRKLAPLGAPFSATS